MVGSPPALHPAITFCPISWASHAPDLRCALVEQVRSGVPRAASLIDADRAQPKQVNVLDGRKRDRASATTQVVEESGERRDRHDISTSWWARCSKTLATLSASVCSSVATEKKYPALRAACSTAKTILVGPNSGVITEMTPKTPQRRVKRARPALLGR